MNGIDDLLVDTNAAIYLLGGDPSLSYLMQGKNLYISFVTELELLGYKGIKEADRLMAEAFIAQCSVVGINAGIKENTIALRKKYRIKLPDAIVMATSMFLGVAVITSDKGFRNIPEIDLLLYDRGS